MKDLNSFVSDMSFSSHKWMSIEKQEYACGLCENGKGLHMRV